jgi:hypothetical protein
VELARQFGAQLRFEKVQYPLPSTAKFGLLFNRCTMNPDIAVLATMTIVAGSGQTMSWEAANIQKAADLVVRDCAMVAHRGTVPFAHRGGGMRQGQQGQQRQQQGQQQQRRRGCTETVEADLSHLSKAHKRPWNESVLCHIQDG